MLLLLSGIFRVFIFVLCTFLLRLICFFGSCCWYLYCHHHHHRLPQLNHIHTHKRANTYAYTFLTVLAKKKFSWKWFFIKSKCNQELTLVRFVTLWWNRYRAQINKSHFDRFEEKKIIETLFFRSVMCVFELNFEIISVLNRCLCVRTCVDWIHLKARLGILKYSILDAVLKYK